jgi:tryptophanyl-tRNA synthetase
MAAKMTHASTPKGLSDGLSNDRTDDLAVQDNSAGQPQRRPTLLTGDRPTGPLHLGHYVGSLKTRLALQHSHDTFILLANAQALTDNADNPQRVQKAICEVMLDYLAVGLDPAHCRFVLQSQISALYELAAHYLNVVSLGQLERNPTVKAEIQMRGFADSIPVGFLCYPVAQAADITGFGDPKAGDVIVPVGDDQRPMLELTNDIVRRMHNLYGDGLLSFCQARLSPSGRLVGIDGQNKASKSLNNAIFLKDDPETVRAKVMQMFTDPGHIKISDPGQVEGNVVFAYLDAFHGDQEEVCALKAQYRRGGLGDMALKKMLIQDLEVLLAPIRQRRADIVVSDIQDLLADGTAQANLRVQATVQRVRKALCLD